MTWLDYNATGGGNGDSNFLAGICRPWNNAAQTYTTVFDVSNVGHASIADTNVVTSIPGH